jgi:hypothetical protein
MCTEPHGGGHEFLEKLRQRKVSSADIPNHDCAYFRKVSLFQTLLEVDESGGQLEHSNVDDVTGQSAAAAASGSGSEAVGDGIVETVTDDDEQTKARRAEEERRLKLLLSNSEDGEGGAQDRRQSTGFNRKMATSLLDFGNLPTTTRHPDGSDGGLDGQDSAAAAAGHQPNDGDQENEVAEDGDGDGDGDRSGRRRAKQPMKLKTSTEGVRRPAGRQPCADLDGAGQEDDETKDDDAEEKAQEEPPSLAGESGEARTVQVPDLPDPFSKRRRSTLFKSRPRMRPSVSSGVSSILDGVTLTTIRPLYKSPQDYNDSRYIYPPLVNDGQHRMTSHGGRSNQCGSLDLSQPIRAGRFELPVDLMRLADMSPDEYLSQCCRLAPDQDAIYRLIYRRHVNVRTEKLHSLELRRALRDVIPADVSEDDVRRLCVMSGVEPDRFGIECDLFVGMASLAVRFMQPRTSSLLSSSVLPSAGTWSTKKTILESTDLSALSRKLDGIVVNPGVMRLLEALT